MAKFLHIAVGVVAGALGGALVVLLIAFVVVPGIYDPGPDTVDFATPMVILGAMWLGALLGGAMGAVAGIKVAEGHIRRGAVTFAGTLGVVAVLTLLAAGGLWAMIHIPRSGPNDSAKEKWARGHGPLDPQYGLSLAHQLIDCHDRSGGLTPEGLARGGCTPEHSFRIGNTRASYDQFDNGWRWESVKTARGYKVVVRPDPLLKHPGPIFEFDEDRLLVRRASAEAPPFAADSPLPGIEPYRRCLSENGPDGCGHFERPRESAQKHVMGPAESFAITLNDPTTRPLQIRLFPTGRYAEGQFELHVAGKGRRYMFQQDGGWHVSAVPSGIAIPKDAPPYPCELDPKVPCNTETQQAVEDAREKLYDRIATRIRFALRANPRDRVIVRFDPQAMPGLERAVEKDLRANRVELVPYGPVENFEERLAGAVAYVWLPTTIPTPGDQLAALVRWTDQGGPHHEIHVHWTEGTLDLDGLSTTHPPGMDERYVAAAETSPVDLIQHMDRARSALATSEVRVTTPAGTDIRFRTGDRPFNRQIGAFDRDKARIRIDRHVEVPPGVLRVAPVEATVSGVIVFPSFRIRDGVRATDVRLEFTDGRITRATAREGQGELENYLRTQPALGHFREFCLGFNPQLALRPDERVIPYYGYGAGVVRMSLGDNEELGGTVRGGAVRWNFFVDATVSAGGQIIVKDGRLILP